MYYNYILQYRCNYIFVPMHIYIDAIIYLYRCNYIFDFVIWKNLELYYNFFISILFIYFIEYFTVLLKFFWPPLHMFAGFVPGLLWYLYIPLPLSLPLSLSPRYWFFVQSPILSGVFNRRFRSSRRQSISISGSAATSS